MIAFVDTVPDNELPGPYNFDIFTMNFDGSGKTRLTNATYDSYPSWSR